MKRTPSIGMRGIYSVKAPFSVVPTEVYVCHAVRSFKDLHERGIDPYTQYYEPRGLSRNDYREDYALKANIVTLVSENTNNVIYVPDTYILSYPDMSGVKYQRVVVSVDMGMIPDYLDLEFLQSEIRGMVTQMTGVNATTNTHIAPTTNAISANDHQTLEAARLSRIESTQITYARLIAQQQENQRLREMIEDMTQILLDNNLIT